MSSSHLLSSLRDADVHFKWADIVDRRRSVVEVGKEYPSRSDELSSDEAGDTLVLLMDCRIRMLCVCRRLTK